MPLIEMLTRLNAWGRDTVNVPSVACHQPHNATERTAKVVITSTAPSDCWRVVLLDDRDRTR